MATATSMMGKAVIGPASWSNVTVKDVNTSDSLCRRSNKSCALGKKLDPLPHMREIIREISNNEAQRYFRQTRNVASILRESMADTNEEIKSLTRGKEALEKIVEHTRKDIKLNKDNVECRGNRPPKELVRAVFLTIHNIIPCQNYYYLYINCFNICVRVCMCMCVRAHVCACMRACIS